MKNCVKKTCMLKPIFKELHVETSAIFFTGNHPMDIPWHPGTATATLMLCKKTSPLHRVTGGQMGATWLFTLLYSFQTFMYKLLYRT